MKRTGLVAVHESRFGEYDAVVERKTGRTVDEWNRVFLEDIRKAIGKDLRRGDVMNTRQMLRRAEKYGPRFADAVKMVAVPVGVVRQKYDDAYVAPVEGAADGAVPMWTLPDSFWKEVSVALKSNGERQK